MAAPIADIVALTPVQRGMYLVSAGGSGVDPYITAFSLDTSGVPVERVRECAAALIRRHPHLAGRVVADGLPHPVLIIGSQPEPGWEEVDVRSAPDPQAAADAVYQEHLRRGVDLDHGPLTRIVAIRTADDRYRLGVYIHHVVVDGWSIPILFAEMLALLADSTVELPEAPAVREHAARLAADDEATALAAWTAELVDLAPMPMIAGPAVDADFPIVGEHQLGEAAGARVRAWARAHDLTVNTVLQLAWARVVGALLSRRDVVFGQTSSGREGDIPGVEAMVGALISTVPVRVAVDDRSPAQVGADLQRRFARLQPFGRIGINRIAGAAAPGAASAPALFDTLLVYENMPIVDPGTRVDLPGGGAVAAGRVDSPSHFPIAMAVLTLGDRVIARAEVRPDLVGRFDPDQLAHRFTTVLERLVDADRFADIDPLLPDEAPALTVSLVIGAIDRTVTAVLGEVDGSATAVIDRHGEQTFAQFRAAVDRLAGGLWSIGVRPGDAVAVALGRDRRVLYAPFALARIGALCVHLDPGTPAGRVDTILGVSGARHLLGNAVGRSDAAGVLIPDLDGGLPDVVVDPGIVFPEIHPDAPLYAIFTSGTTGVPKGVVATHRGLLSLWRHHDHRVHGPTVARLGRPLRVGHNWSTGFDAAWQPTIGLLGGHAIAMVPDEIRTDAQELLAFVERCRVDFMETSPSLFLRLADAGLVTGQPGAEHCGLSILGLGGEAIHRDTWERLRGLADTRVVNFYGPTETTVDAVTAEISQSAEPVIGRPVDGMTAAALDTGLRPVPAGGFGELYLSGPQVTIGYLGRPGLTASTFVAAPGGERRYRTGDLVSIRSDGNLAYLGRIDNQTKINGFRVEPAEVAVALRRLAGVRNAEVIVDRSRGRDRLAALVVSERDTPGLRADLARDLPAFMVPTTVVHVDQIPLTDNDKLDTAAARTLVAAALARPESADEALGPVHKLLTDLTGLGIDDSPADQGLDSLAIMDVVTRLRRQGYAVSPHDILGAADLRELAHIISRS
ncbi:amino acid adenylation domain-containing protein [Millisia brevis]|uniref:amino acid adenylation domain-containing protein n=1 Tax=Millisia brevis TaxID=264148 RepID=UPI000A01E570|nr:amino acid adenylation domain-containing protein [Millisia brevis]